MNEYVELVADWHLELTDICGLRRGIVKQAKIEGVERGRETQKEAAREQCSQLSRQRRRCREVKKGV